jgi:hypothetical protein
MDLTVSSAITLTLPGFERRSGDISDFEVQCTPSGKFTMAAWNEDTKTLQLSVQNVVRAQTRVEIIVPGGSSGLWIPNNGVGTNLATLLVESDSLEGRVPPTTISSTKGVGTFTNTPTIAYDPPKVQVDTSIAVTFAAKMPLSAQDTVTLRLAGFSRAGGDYIDASTHQSFEVTWSEAAQSLTFKFRDAIPARELVDVALESALGFRLPPGGVKENDLSLTIASSAIAGPVLPTTIANSPPVGSFKDSVQLYYSPACAPGSGCTIYVEFRPTMALVRGDFITVTLSKFTGPNSTSLPVSESLPVSAGSLTSWDPALGRFQTAQSILYWNAVNTSILVFVEALRIEAGTACRIDLVASEVGIALPVDGVRLDQPGLSIESTASEGPVLPTPVRYSIRLNSRSSVRLLPGKEWA